MGYTGEIVEGGVPQDLQALVDDLVRVETKIKEVNGQSVSIMVDLKGAENLTRLIELTDRQQAAIVKLNEVKEQNVAVTQQQAAAANQYGRAAIENAEQLVHQRLELGYVNEQMKHFNKNIIEGKGNMEANNALLAEYTKRQQEVKIEIGATTSAIKSQIKEYNAASASMDQMSQQLFQMKEQYRALSAVERENSEVGGKLLLDIKLLDGQLKVLDSTIGNNQRNVGNYSGALEAAGLSLDNLRVKMAQLDAAGQKESIEFKTLESDAIRTELAMKQMANSLTTVSGTSVTTSAQLGVLKTKMQEMVVAGKQDSAEFREMQVEAQRLAAAMREVSASTGRAIFSIENATRRVETMFFRMAIHFVIITALIGTISALVEWFTKLSDAEQEAADRLEDYTSSVKNLHKAQGDLKSDVLATVFFDESKMRSQMSILKDQNLTLDQRFRAYKALQSIAPGVLDDMDKEAFKTAENTKRMDTQLASMQKYIELQTRITKERELQKITIEAQQKNESELDELVAKRDEIVGRKVSIADETKITSRTTPGAYLANDLEKTQVNINRLRKDRLVIDKDVLEANTRLMELDKQMAALQGDVKDKKEKKANAKGLDAELAHEKALYEIQLQKNQALYNKSGHLLGVDDKAKADADLEAVRQYYTNATSIIIKYHGKVGESEEKFKARLAQQKADELAVENATNEEERKIALEIQKRHDQAGKDIDELIKKMREQQQALRDIQRETDEISASAAAHKQRAGGYSPLLEALGFDADFKENQSTFDRQIAAAKQKKAELTGAQYNAYLSGNPLEYGKATENVENAGKDIAQLEADKQKAIDDKVIQAKKEAAEKAIELTQQTFAAIKQIQEQQYAWEQQQLQFKMESVQLQSKQQMDAIDATTNFAIVKDNQKAKLAAQTAAEGNALQAKSNELKIKQARWEKQNAEMTIVANTATAIIKTIAAYAGIPGGFLLAAPIVAIEAAIGAAQYAAASSAPLPQFEKGGTTKTALFRAGEKGAEIGITPSGKAMVFAKDSVYSAPIGTNIKTADETQKLINYAISGIGYNGGSLSAMQEKKEQAMNDKRIVEKLDEVSDNIIQAAMIGRVIRNTVVIQSNHDQQRLS